MVNYAWDANGEARAALDVVVQDYGVDALSNSQFLMSLLKDLLPGAPRESNVLVAAAEVNVAGVLRDRLAQHISTDAAVAQAAGLLEERTGLAPDACQWAVRQMAEMIGLPVEAGETRPQPQAAQDTYTWPRPSREQETLVPPSAPQPPPQSPWAAPQGTPNPFQPPGPQPFQPPGPQPFQQAGPRRSPTDRSGAARVAGWAGLVCALSVPLQLLEHGGIYMPYGWLLTLTGLTLFVAAVLTLVGASRRIGSGLIFAATLSVVQIFIEQSVSSGLGGGLVAASVLSTVAAVVAAVGALVYFAPELRWTNLRTPLAALYTLAAIGLVVAEIPGGVQFQSGSDWLTANGYVGSGVHGRFLFAGIVAIVTLILPAVFAGLLPSGTGVRAGVIAGFLAINVAAGIDITLLATEPDVRAAAALYVSWIIWAIAVALGIALLATSRGRPAGNAQPALAG
jgi:hypothetical protein